MSLSLVNVGRTVPECHQHRRELIWSFLFAIKLHGNSLDSLPECRFGKKKLFPNSIKIISCRNEDLKFPALNGPREKKYQHWRRKHLAFNVIKLLKMGENCSHIPWSINIMLFKKWHVISNMSMLFLTGIHFKIHRLILMKWGERRQFVISNSFPNSWNWIGHGMVWVFRVKGSPANILLRFLFVQVTPRMWKEMSFQPHRQLLLTFPTDVTAAWQERVNQVEKCGGIAASALASNLLIFLACSVLHQPDKKCGENNW